MSEYRTYVSGKDNFSTERLSDIQITIEAGSESTQYTIRAKCGLDTPLRRILELIEIGMEFKITLADGKKYKLRLVPLE